MDIDGVGPAVLQAMIDAGLVQNPADLYTLTVQDIAQLDRMGLKSAQNAVSAIEASKQNDLSKLICALGMSARKRQKCLRKSSARWRRWNRRRSGI